MHDSSHKWEKEWNEEVRINIDKRCTIEIQKVKIFPKSLYSLLKIITDDPIQILNTLLRLDLYTHVTYEIVDLIPLCHDPKIDMMTPVLFH